MALISEKLTLINEALSGFSSLAISSLVEESFDAKQALRVWDTSVRELVSFHQWSFLIRNKKLNDNTEADTFEYKYKHSLPEDFSRPIIVLTSFSDLSFLYAYDFSRTLYRGDYVFSEYQITYPYFYTNYPNPLYVVYSSLDIEKAFVSENFKLALVYIMRRELALTKKNSIAIHDRYEQKAIIEKRKAQFEDFKMIKRRYRELKNIDYNPFKSL